MLIRKATPEDLALIRQVEQQAETAAHWDQRQYDALFAPQASPRIALVLSDDAKGRRVRGFVIAHCAGDEWEIENLVVAKEEQGRGLGGEMVRELLREARRAGATSVLLEVRESNAAARQLYKNVGFIEIGRRPAYYRNPHDDALLLKISIAVL